VLIWVFKYFCQDQGRMASYATPKEGKKNLNKWYSLICSYPINMLVGYQKQFCWFKGTWYYTNIDNIFSL